MIRCLRPEGMLAITRWMRCRRAMCEASRHCGSRSSNRSKAWLWSLVEHGDADRETWAFVQGEIERCGIL